MITKMTFNPSWNELEACRDSLREHMAMLRQNEAALSDILDLINDWQQDGRNGHCLPVIRGRQLEALELSWRTSAGEIVVIGATRPEWLTICLARIANRFLAPNAQVNRPQKEET